MNLVKLKTSLQKAFLGRLVINVYHYLYSVPVSYLMLLKYRIMAKKKVEIQFYNDDEVFVFLTNNHKSLTRFGDGEIAWIYKDAKGYFGQDNSDELSEALKKALTSKRDSLLVGIPNFFTDMETYTKERKRNREIHLSQYIERWRELIDPNSTYADALITRVYNGRVNINFEERFSKWKGVWNRKSVCVVEGTETRFGVGNDLLANAKVVKRILCPSENAFSKYKEIYEVAKSKKDEFDLFLIALGPTASVLAYDLDAIGCQAIDIGHLDIEYEWFLRGAHSKMPIVGKYVNEAGGSSTKDFDSSLLDAYNSEIILKV